jgi:hypothetical protein
MLQVPMVSFKKAIEFLDLRYEDEEIAQAINHGTFDTLKAMEIKDGYAERGNRSEAFFRNGRAGEGVSALSDTQIGEVVKTHGEMMKRFGYL